MTTLKPNSNQYGTIKSQKHIMTKRGNNASVWLVMYPKDKNSFSQNYYNIVWRELNIDKRDKRNYLNSDLKEVQKQFINKIKQLS